MSSHERARHLLAGVLSLASLVPAARAIESITIDTAQIEGLGLDARGVSLRLGAGQGAPSAELAIEELTLPEPIGRVRGLRAHCDALRIAGGSYECTGGTLRFAPAGGRQSTMPPPGNVIELQGRVRFDGTARALDLDVDVIDAGGAPLTARATLASGRWTLDLNASRYAVTSLAGWLGTLVDLTGAEAPAGTIALEAHAEGGAEIESLRVRAALNTVTISAFGERLAAQALDGGVDVDAKRRGDGFATDIALRATAGQVYADPWFVDAAAHPFSISGAGDLAPALQRLTLSELEVDQPGVLVGTGGAVIEPGAVRSLVLDLDEARLPGAYDIYLQPLLIGTVLDELDTQGGATGRIEIVEGMPVAVDVELADVHAEDRAGRFGAYGVSGPVRWAANAPSAQVSDLRYAGAAIYGIPFDAGRMRIESARGALRILDTPLRLSLLDGALSIHTLALRGLGSDDVEADFDAVLEPVDVARLTSALGWVPFSGTLSGRLPTLRYAGGVVTLGGALEAEIFGGHMSLDGLRIEQPLGVLPSMRADVRMRDIDLERLTSTFSFGHMTGKLHVDILGIELLDWQAERFDARIWTPEDDDSRHRISQRAVKSIASIGGGATAELSTRIVRIFDEFNYDRIDLRCVMRDQVCAMDGIATKGAGYYILRGRGLPRLDVVGFERTVSWPALSQAVWSAARSGDVVIQ
jgi:hypothetical protein